MREGESYAKIFFPSVDFNANGSPLQTACLARRIFSGLQSVTDKSFDKKERLKLVVERNLDGRRTRLGSCGRKKYWQCQTSCKKSGDDGRLSKFGEGGR